MEKKQSVLVIDDSPTVRRLAELVLSQEGYEVFTAEDGDDGLQIARKEVPSVIIVDFIMPKMNGYQLCKNIRSDSILNDVPIVLITSKGKDVGQGFDEKFGIVRYLQKPFEAEALTTTVKEALAEREQKSGVRSKDIASEEVPEHTAPDAEPDSHTPVQNDTLAPDISFVEIGATDTGFADEHAAETSPDTSLTAAADTAPEDSTSESSPADDAGSAPVEPPAQKSIPSAPPHGALQENIEKELRYYFGQELTVLLKNTIIQALKETDLVRTSRRILSGEVRYISIANVLRFVSMSGVSGKLSVLANDFNSEIYLDGGQIVFASVSRLGSRTCLEELMMKDENFQRSEVVSVFSEARGNCFTAGGILLERGFITEDELNDYYRRLSEDAVHQTLAAAAGHFYIEDIPLPLEIRNIKLQIPVNGVAG